MVYKLLDDLYDLRKDPKEEVTHYVARARAIARTIRSDGEVCSDRHVIHRILAGLPSDYEVLAARWL